MPRTVLWVLLSQLLAAALHVLRKSRNKHEGSYLLHSCGGVIHLIQQTATFSQHLIFGAQHFVIQRI